MTLRISASIAAIVVGASVASAGEFTGGSADLGYSKLGSNLAKTTLAATGEFGFSRTFGLQGDIGTYRLDEANETGYNGTLHAVFHVSPQGSLGAYYGIDRITDDGNYKFYGVEGGMDFAPEFGGEAYLNGGDLEGTDVTQFGFLLSYDVGTQAAITGGIDRIDIDGGLDMTKYALGVNFDASDNINLYAEVGNFNASIDTGAGFDISGSDNFVGIGAKVTFGPAGRSTFKRRGFLNIIPGL